MIGLEIILYLAFGYGLASVTVPDDPIITSVKICAEKDLECKKDWPVMKRDLPADSRGE